jgi:hypothetical protein
MRTLLASAVALGAFTSVALAEPLALSDVQMDALTAGQVDVTQSNIIMISITQSNISEVTTSGDATVNQSNSASVSVSQGNSSTINAPPADG